MRPVCLIVMDGWGINPKKKDNAVLLASTPCLDSLSKKYPTTSLDTSGLSVGLPAGQMGNSEVGHLTMGAGRVIFQDLTRINQAIKERTFHENPELNAAIINLKESGGALHLMGLVSDGGVHSHIDHLFALVDVAREAGLERVYIHAFMDGRDTPPHSGKGYIEQVVRRLDKVGVGEIATVAGRYYAMDRDRRWDRVRKAYSAIVASDGRKAADPVSAIEDAYLRGESDEFIQPTVIIGHNQQPHALEDNDAVVFFNFRSDRARELTHAIVDEEFDGFNRKNTRALSAFLCMCEYDARLNLPVLFGHQGVRDRLGEVLSRNSVEQLRVSETEKYAHVTFFFNCGVEAPYNNEQRLLIPSDKTVATYDEEPGMRAKEIADAVIEKMEEGRGGFVLVNFANGDMVGHTGVLEAAVKACEAVDRNVGRVVDCALKKGWVVLVTSDHGNCEQMKDYRTDEPHTAHTSNPVPFIMADGETSGQKLRTGGGLQDVAPTILKIMGIEKPVDMTGEPLF